MASVPSANYYATLEIERDASTQQINKAFRKLALKHHPDKHEGAEQAVLAFRAVCESYEVLSEPRLRSVYDQFEEAGLKEGVPDGQGGLIGGSYRFSGDPKRIFETFFGSTSPFGEIYGGARHGRGRWEGEGCTPVLSPSSADKPGARGSRAPRTQECGASAPIPRRGRAQPQQRAHGCARPSAHRLLTPASPLRTPARPSPPVAQLSPTQPRRRQTRRALRSTAT
jgi:curved DNA-binding protein CbpA